MDDFLLIIRLVCHLGTAYAIGRYYDPRARYRPIVSITAALIVGASLAAAFHVFLFRPESHQLFCTLAAATLLVAAIRCHGNVAELFKVGSHAKSN